jgi:hypothetical protein
LATKEIRAFEEDLKTHPVLGNINSSNNKWTQYVRRTDRFILMHSVVIYVSSSRERGPGFTITETSEM